MAAARTQIKGANRVNLVNTFSNYPINSGVLGADRTVGGHGIVQIPAHSRNTGQQRQPNSQAQQRRGDCGRS